MDIENDPCVSSLIQSWWRLMGDRHRLGTLAPNKLKLTEDIRLLITDSTSLAKKVRIKDMANFNKIGSKMFLRSGS